MVCTPFVQILLSIIVCEVQLCFCVWLHAVSSFLLLCSILLCKHTPIYLSIPLMMDLMAVPDSELSDNTAMNIFIHIFQ